MFRRRPPWQFQCFTALRLSSNYSHAWAVVFIFARLCFLKLERLNISFLYSCNWNNTSCAVLFFEMPVPADECLGRTLNLSLLHPLLRDFPFVALFSKPGTHSSLAKRYFQIYQRRIFVRNWILVNTDTHQREQILWDHTLPAANVIQPLEPLLWRAVELHCSWSLE